MGAWLEQRLVQAGSLAEVDWPALRAVLATEGVAAVRGLVQPSAIAHARARLEASFRRADDAVLDPARPETIRGNYQRLFVGGVSRRGVERPRFLRTFYNPLDAPDSHGMHAVFRVAVGLRNGLHGLEPCFAASGPQDGLWTAARIHHYPRGGGFMARHSDDVLAAVARAHGLTGYYQVVVVMSRRGVDFRLGGAFLEREGERTYLEDHLVPGDLAIYDGRIPHGVEDIDPDCPLDLDSLAGRLAGFVSLYELR